MLAYYDAYFQSAFAYGVFLSFIFYFTGWSYLEFDLFPIGILSLIIVGYTLYYFLSNKKYYINISEEGSQMIKGITFWTIIVFIFILGFTAPVLYKYGLLK